MSSPAADSPAAESSAGASAETSGQRGRSRLYLGLLLLVFGLPQLRLALGAWDMGVDGGYYLDVAMNVRDGLGLVSDVSLYHSGFPSFPHATPIYPLWPELLGHVGRVVPITKAAHWLPFGLWLASLVLAWAAGGRLAPAPLFGVRGLHAGHLLAFLLGTQREYSRFSLMPYTEALAFALLMGMFWRLAGMRVRLRDGVELGLWLVLLCLCRSQLFVVPVAVAMGVGVVAALGGPAARRWLLPGALALAMTVAALLVWWMSVRTYIPDAGPLVLLRFDQAQVSEVLTPIDVIKDSKGLLDLVLDRLGGVVVAWNPFARELSYGRGFFLAHWALPGALIAGVPLLRRSSWTRLRALLGAQAALPWLVVLLCGLGGLASVHLPHKEDFGEWYFHRRHALIAVVAFFPALLLMVRHPSRLVRLVALALLLGQAGMWGNSQYYRQDDASPNAEERRNRLISAWLREHSSAEEPLVVAVNAFVPPELAWRTKHVGYHWFYQRTSTEDLVAMFDELGADLLIFREGITRDWDFREDAKAFNQTWIRVSDGPPFVETFERRPADPVR